MGAKKIFGYAAVLTAVYLGGAGTGYLAGPSIEQHIRKVEPAQRVVVQYNGSLPVLKQTQTGARVEIFQGLNGPRTGSIDYVVSNTTPEERRVIASKAYQGMPAEVQHQVGHEMLQGMPLEKRTVFIDGEIKALPRENQVDIIVDAGTDVLLEALNSLTSDAISFGQKYSDLTRQNWEQAKEEYSPDRLRQWWEERVAEANKGAASPQGPSPSQGITPPQGPSQSQGTTTPQGPSPGQ
ncbi:hypothetical protein J4460_07915 [Candidatus Woesearchaeota archaeon]|nr:hypothetical protein [Candidatus Woesearchaeota archaeon]HIH38333.1 hypothetical protein [Candidatus Woesearchaeota archaeon]HIH48241.1 hypothetical protein [Candidatus Woesearchaeota archaeon]HIJ03275.1 hypothetical protein [Candidatus Woesearchaeota archaeon]